MAGVTVEEGIIAGLALLVVLLAGFILGSRGRRRRAKGDLVPLPPGMEALAPAFGELRTQLTDVAAKVAALSTTEEARRGPEDTAWEAIRRVENTLATFGQMPSVQQALQDQVNSALADLAQIRQLQGELRQRWMREDTAFDALQRLNSVMLGAAGAGATGEHVVQEMLAQLPPQWIVTNHAVGGRRVEFAVRLPDNLWLPIDSKMVAQSELDALEQETDESKRKRLEKSVPANLLQRVREVRQYVDNNTPGFAIAAVPDAAYRLSLGVLGRAFQEHRALVVPYSLLGPFVLMVYEQHRRNPTDLDTAKVAQSAADAEAHLTIALNELNNRMSGALTQLQNGKDLLSRELAAARVALAQVHATPDEGGLHLPESPGSGGM
jgi:hypothetical protein